MASTQFFIGARFSVTRTDAVVCGTLLAAQRLRSTLHFPEVTLLVARGASRVLAGGIVSSLVVSVLHNS